MAVLDHLMASLGGDPYKRCLDLEAGIRLIVREELASREASVLGDPDVADAAQSAAGQQMARRRWSLARARKGRA